MSGSPQPAPEEDVKPKLTITIAFEGQVTSIKAKTTTPFEKIFKAVEAKFQKAPGTLKFTFDGTRVLPTDTPGELNMENDDQIDAHLAQIGGGARPRWC